MNIIEPLNHDAVISLDNPDDKFHSESCTFRASEIRHALYQETRGPQNKWFGYGMSCEVLMPNHDWRAGKIMLQLGFIEDPSEVAELELQTNKSESQPRLFNHSRGLVEVLHTTGVVSLDEWNNDFHTISKTCLLSQIVGTVLKTYEPDEPGYRWFGEGVPCSVLSPKTPWRRGKVTLQACFVADVVEEELVEEVSAVTEEVESNSDEATETLSPLDEIRQMAANPS